jgi:hypothetical protein
MEMEGTCEINTGDGGWGVGVILNCIEQKNKPIS